MYDGIVTNIRICGGLTNEFSITIGAYQGSALTYFLLGHSNGWDNEKSWWENTLVYAFHIWYCIDWWDQRKS